MTDSSSRKPSRWLRRLFQAVLLLLLVLIGWYAQNRVRAKNGAISVKQLELPRPGQQLTTEPEILTLACFNIAHGRGTNTSNWSDATERDMRLVDISRLLNSLRVDIAVLNEVDFDSAWSGHEDQAKIISAIPGYPYVLEQRNLDVSLPFFRLRFGNAILSRYPLESARPVQFPARSSWEHMLAGSKQGTCVDVLLSQRTRIRVMPVHLEHRDDATRAGSVEEILKCAKESPLPFFCLGDFNATRSDFQAAKAGKGGGPAVDLMLKSGLFQTSPETEPASEQLTFPSFAVDRKIDWIMVPTQWQIVTQQVVASVLSDHRPVVMKVRVPQRN